MDQLEQKVEDLKVGFATMQIDIKYIKEKVGSFRSCAREQVEAKIDILEKDVKNRDKWFNRINVVLFITLVLAMFKENIAKLFT